LIGNAIKIDNFTFSMSNFKFKVETEEDLNDWLYNINLIV